MLADTKEQMKEQQTRLDRDREQAVLDRKNATHEHRERAAEDTGSSS